MIPRFRAWDEKNKEMFKDTFAVTESGEVVTVEQDFITIAPDYIFVDHLTLMQSTGLTDKNGKEIFEGDILSIETDEENVKVEVSWDSKHALFVFESKKYNEKEALGELFEDNSYPFKIIGNVWEHPELAEVSSWT